METENNITELRGILFETLRGLKDKSIDIEQAKAINDTAQTIINSAKVEVDHARITGGIPSTNFLTEKVSAPEFGKHAGGYVHKIGQRHG